MKIFRPPKEANYFKEELIYNDDFGSILDFVIDIITKRKIKKIHFGHDCQYLVFRGDIKAYMTKRKNRNHKSLILKATNLELECLLEYWDEIKIKEREISIDDAGLYIIFENSIWRNYLLFKKMIEVRNENMYDN